MEQEPAFSEEFQFINIIFGLWFVLFSFSCQFSNLIYLNFYYLLNPDGARGEDRGVDGAYEGPWGLNWRRCEEGI